MPTNGIHTPMTRREELRCWMHTTMCVSHASRSVIITGRHDSRDEIRSAILRSCTVMGLAVDKTHAGGRRPIWRPKRENTCRNATKGKTRIPKLFD